jgi:hypothetical protein
MNEQPLTREQITEQVENTNLNWVDQYIEMLRLTVQALQKLHEAFDRKFSR